MRIRSLSSTPRELLFGSQPVVQVFRKKLNHPAKSVAGFAPFLGILQDVSASHEAADIVWILRQDVVDDPPSPDMVLRREVVHEGVR